jgi:predicted secreted Zn-dependent protease
VRVRVTAATIFVLVGCAFIVKAAHATTTTTIVKRVFRYHPEHANCIARLESSLRPDAVHVNKNGSVDRGLFQINSFWLGKRVHYFSRAQRRGVSIVVTAARLFDPYYNARVAWAISKGGHKWGPWTTAGHC